MEALLLFIIIITTIMRDGKREVGVFVPAAGENRKEFSISAASCKL